MAICLSDGGSMANLAGIIGGNGIRNKNDFYPTPPECTFALLDFLEEKSWIKKGDIIWEPACGSMAMVDAMRQKGYSVIGTDIIYNQDYLTTDLKEDYDWIITNPPFCAAESFIVRSVSNNKPFALLLKSQYWHSAKRRKLFIEHQPSYVLPLTWRPDFTGKGSSLLDMLWCVWIGSACCTYYQPLKKPSLQDIQSKKESDT